MSRISKRMKSYLKNIDSEKNYSANEAIEIIKKCATAKFDESVDVSIMLGIDVKKSDQTVRGATLLPSGLGKTVKVAVFAQGANAQAAKEAGADIVGFEDLAESIKNGIIDFDVLVATPDAMRLVGQLGTILGPKGLMPNPKVGTVSANVALAVKNVKGGQVSYRADKNGIIHCNIGKASFSVEQLSHNLQALMVDLKKLRPTTSKGLYFKKITLSSTMGPGIKVDLSTISV